MASGNFTPSWPLSGAKSIVEPGHDIDIRLMPRWDYANSLVLDPKTNTRIANPAYDINAPAFVWGLEHWWESEAGKTTREWCPRIFDVGPKAYCPVCVAAAEMARSAAKEDQKYGKRIGAKEVFVFNAVVGDPRRLNDEKLVDIRTVSLTGTMYYAVSDIMTGGDKQKFARGLVTDPREGYDLSFKRPPAGGNERWTVQAAVAPTPLYGPAQAAAFKGWVTRLTDLDKMLKDETKDAAGMFKAFYGRDPEPGELGEGPASPPAPKGAGTAQAPPSQVVNTPVSSEPEAESAEPPSAPDDEFLDMIPSAGTASAPRPGARAPRR
jgi:hypothetical protein